MTCCTYLIIMGVPVYTRYRPVLEWDSVGLLAHTALVLPYAVRVVSSSLNNLRSDMEEAAVLLGCTRLQAFTKVVLPNIRGGVLAAF